MSKMLNDSNVLIPRSSVDDSPYRIFLQDGYAALKQYEPESPYLRLPFAKFHDANILLDAYARGGAAMKAIALGTMSKELRANEEEMLKIIKRAPEAILHIDRSLATTDFFIKALDANPKTYDLLPIDAQQSKDIIDAYAKSMIKPGDVHDIWGITSIHNELMEIFPTAVSDKCNKELFYSVENYQKAYEDMVKNGAYRVFTYGNPREGYDYNRYSTSTMFVNMARLSFAHDPVMLARYQYAEAEIIAANIDKLAGQIERCATDKVAIQNAEAIAMAANTLENPPAIIGVEPQPAQHLTDKVIEAEKTFYVNLGETTKKMINAIEQNQKTHKSLIDDLVVLAEKHPEMGLTSKEIDHWWQLRGQDISEKLQEYAERGEQHPWDMELRRLRKLSETRPAMRVDEQLKIEGFDQNDIGFDRR